MLIIFQIIFSYAYSHILEYFAHRFLHLFKRKKQLFSFHIRDHHVQAKRNKMLDNLSVREVFALSILAILHAPLAFYFPAAYITLIFAAMEYLYVHTRSHNDLMWASKKVPWHINHHLQDWDKNWGVRSNLFDKIMNTAD